MSIDIIFYLKAAGKALLFATAILAAFYLMANMVIYIILRVGKKSRTAYKQVIETIMENMFKGRKLLSKVFLFFTMLFFGLPIIKYVKK